MDKKRALITGGLSAAETPRVARIKTGSCFVLFGP